MGRPLNGIGQTPIRLAVASGSDVLCLEVATQLADVIAGVPMVAETSGPAEWSARVTDAAGRSCDVEIARVPFERDASERRRVVLERADVVMLVADAMLEAMPIAEAALAEVRAGTEARPIPVVVFGIGPSAGGGPDAEAIRGALGFAGGDVVIAAGSADRDGLQLAFDLAVRAVTGGHVAAGSPPPAVAVGLPADGAPLPSPAPANEPPVAPFGVELNPAAAATGSVEIAAPVWAALTELIGGIDPRGDSHRSLLVSGLLAHGIVVERHEIAGADAMWIQPVVTPNSANAAGADPTDGVDRAADELRQLKGIRQNVVG